MNNLINFLLFQAIWLAVALGAAKQQMVPALFLLSLFFWWQTHPRNRHRNDFHLLGFCLALGFLLDSLWAYSALITYAIPYPSTEFAPYWIMLLWLAFALTLNHSLSWIYKYPWLGVILGASGGPLSYLAAQRIGAIKIENETAVVPLLAIAWGMVMWLLTRKSVNPPVQETHAVGMKY